MKEKLVVKGLTHIYGGQGTEVLNNVNFSVMDGEFLSILGPSGCGKTTILRILTGLILPSKGTITKDGVDITRLAPGQRKMGIVFQNYALFQNMTVLRNVEYALRVHKDTRDIARDIAIAALEKVDLADQMHKKPYRLSGGQQQRVAIARTIALNPEVILFDEPMSALDAATRLSLRDGIKEIQQEYKTTMIYVTHDQEEAFAMSDRIMVMDHGVIQQLDTPENIVNNPANDYVQSFVVDNLQIKIRSLEKYARS